jgi:glycosyltransferase involved in cell wall biosynthesis
MVNLNTSENYLLAIFIPTFERAAILRRTLSLLLPYVDLFNGPSGRIVTVIVSDNASSDATSKVARSFSYDFYFYYCNFVNIGAMNNFYRSVDICNSEYVWVLGDDDIILNEYLGKLIAFIRLRRPDLLFLGGANSIKCDDVSISEPESGCQLESLFATHPVTSLAHISRLIYKREVLLRHKSSNIVAPSFFVWTWIAPAVYQSRSIRCFNFSYPVVYSTKDGGMEIWTGKTALARLVEFDTYIRHVCTTETVRSVAYRINFLSYNFPLLKTLIKALILFPGEKVRIADFVSNLEMECPEARLRFFGLGLILITPVTFFRLANFGYKKFTR